MFHVPYEHQLHNNLKIIYFFQDMDWAWYVLGIGLCYEKMKEKYDKLVGSH